MTRIGWRRWHLWVFIDGQLVHREEVTSARAARSAFLAWRTFNLRAPA